MIGWLKRRARAENIKLVEQNKLAAGYLLEQAELAQASGFGNASEEMEVYSLVLAQLEQARLHLKAGNSLSEQMLNDQLMNNKSMRRVFDEMMRGKKQFAQQFGTVSERIETFDQKFIPNEGWKVYLAHF